MKITTLYFVIYLATGLSIFFGSARQLAVQIIARSLQPLDVVAFAGSLLLISASFLLLSNFIDAIRIAATGCGLCLIYYLPAVAAACYNISSRASDYPFRLFLPAILLAVAVLFTAFLMTRRTTQRVLASSIQRPPSGILMIICMLLGGAVAFESMNSPIIDSLFVPGRTLILKMTEDQRGIPEKSETRILVYPGKTSDCIARFNGPKELSQYLDSRDEVPVTIRLDGDRPTTGIILAVGSWSWRKLPSYERVLTFSLKHGASSQDIDCWAE